MKRVALAMLACGLLHAQDNSVVRSNVDDVVIRSAVEETVVEINVTDSKGHPILDVKPEDLDIYDNGALRKITALTREESLPLTIGLLIDTSGSQIDYIKQHKDAIATFLKNVMRPQDRAFTMGVDAEVRMITDLTSSTEELRTGMRSITSIGEAGRLLSRPCVPTGNGRCVGTLIWDSLEIANRTVLNKLEGRKAIVLITDGWDVGSIATLDQGIRTMQEANTAVYTIRYDASGGGRFGGANAITFENNLKRLSDETGALSIKAPRTLDGPFAEIERELRSRYLATFQVPESARDGRLHQLVVETKRKGLKVRSRTGYRAPTR